MHSINFPLIAPDEDPLTGGPKRHHATQEDHRERKNSLGHAGDDNAKKVHTEEDE